MKPKAEDCPPYFQNYIAQVKEEDCVSALENTEKEIIAYLRTIPEGKGDHAYDDGKWTVKQVLLHICDAERIFAYRALRFARGDAQQNLSFEENHYAQSCHAEARTVQSIIEEFAAIRRSTVLLFKSFSQNTLQNTGNMTAGKSTVNALGFVTAGHANHHIKMLKERYFQN
jgi:uncharacterized damage-inducible protein DinB